MKARFLLLVATGILLILLVPMLLPSSQITILNYIGLSGIVALGLVVLTGISGMTSFGQAAFVGLGAYTTAVLSAHYNVSPWLTLFASIAVSLLVAFVLGLLTLRLAGHYLPLGTLAWAISIYYLFGNLEFLGGHTGIARVPPLRVGTIALDTGVKFFYVIWAAALLFIVVTVNILNSREGRAIYTLKYGDVLAESLGVSSFRSKMLAFLYAALLAAVSGWLYAHFQRFVNPTPFSLNYGIEYLFMAVLGGAGHVAGAFLGSGIITILREFLGDVLPRIMGHQGNFEIILYGVFIVVMFQFAPNGLWGYVQKIMPKAAAVPPEPDNMLPTRKQPERGTLIARIDNVTKRFGGLTAVDHVSFDVCAGEILGLIGPNGAGKTTLFSLISGMSGLSSGRVELLGHDVGRMRPHDIASVGVARTFQHVKLLPGMSVLSNAAMGAYSRGKFGLVAAALRFNTNEERQIFSTAFQQLGKLGLSSEWEKAAGALPLGEQRLLEIARALSADPCLLLLDEPAAGLRHFEKEKLKSVLKGLRDEGISILLVEHDMDFVMGLVDRLVVLDFGVKIAEGKPAEVQNNLAVLEAYLGGVS